jgi:ribosomal protein S8E
MALAAQQLREHRELFFEPDMVSLNQTLKAHVIQVASNPQKNTHHTGCLKPSKKHTSYRLPQTLKAHVIQVASNPQSTRHTGCLKPSKHTS